ncbi:hypothetical protein MPRF_17240 [Mycolicibacterium parafortuitum]|uniref:Uncharacterized protein n=1 Tax=Mycolicibacterium parafortuitum TaxID=39692 RepID=A0A7I7U1M0_MYCPF|nr:hypothetical protein [Mycolicibacterium parafortuitum]PQD98202.1 hypothetical protein CYL16_24085 [Mycobacterium sp. EPG1]BBY74825.1 hypothetical protein MPRF_17240 [Mycolicibacterium parafortuitum]
MTEQCRACRTGLEHCHGALIHHTLRRPECTEDECFVAASDHDMHLDCSAVGCLCDEFAAESAHRVG